MGGWAVTLVGLGCCIPADPTRFEFESRHMGTTFRIVLYAADKPTAEAAAKVGFERVAELDRTFSDYSPTSEAMRLCAANDAAPGVPRPVSADFFAVMVAAQELAKKSDGAFDVTVGPVVKLWRLARRTQLFPDAAALAAARSKVGFDNITLDAATRTVSLKVAGMRLDFGGIAKGYAADEVLKLLRERFGIARALVAASGDVACVDPPPDQPGWRVDIAPLSKGRPARTLLLSNAAVSTSGDLEQFVEIGGVRYSHVLDPRTGIGLTGRRSVTVVARRGITADSHTKAASVLSAERALTLIDTTDGAAVYIVVKDGEDGPERVTQSKRFAEYLSR
jgi:thiamine biosynthesis lipoprotein